MGTERYLVLRAKFMRMEIPGLYMVARESGKGTWAKVKIQPIDLKEFYSLFSKPLSLECRYRT